MLTSLYLKNFVIVDELELDFASGLTVLTGETGAGKSIVLDALGLLLGDRADVGMLRHGADKAELVAEFALAQTPSALAWLLDNDMAGDEEDRLLLRRTLDSAGKSKAYINGIGATLAQLKTLGEMLVDIHGQHAHQQLLRPDVQRELIDGYAEALPLAREVAECWRDWQGNLAQLDDARRNASAFEAERERLQWQIDEVAGLALADAEWEELQAEHKRLHHAASLIDGVQTAIAVLADGDDNCQGWLNRASHGLAELAGYDAQLEAPLELLAGVDAQLAEAVNTLRRYADALELDPDRLAEVEARMDAVWRMARKYRLEPEQLAGQLAQWQQRLATLGGSEGLARLEKAVEQAEAAYTKAARKLSKARSAAAPKLAAAVTAEMRPLALADSRLEIVLEAGAPSAHGLESIDFRVAHGEAPARALGKIVSGGELSRISLSLQVIVSARSGVATLVFDEVDVGIGGRVAEIVGRLLAQLGESRQVLCITHLPQVAAQGRQHLQVSKAKTDAGGIVSAVRGLGRDERIDEIARMLGGVDITETTRKHAAELLGHE
ncbi:DNA repair protein RecN (Recombination protein N) [Andreprevotia lacus DSM 23236]|jgi:DNA repair protein RecN (Recombination protein N)|uniref:DNA repair protein RecN n=1 Tax=Andreprevotia lacus DSM 23236 TaxID=1121001 RepID=A0A1W1XNK8_9NEIS|nr:DNA repair protein RecN [Andreprevotia lacus]SMC25101.1 DNA repair protein RecN (Recombination protein N) [Andreprevotia lacus DSM 23236]